LKREWGGTVHRPFSAKIDLAEKVAGFTDRNGDAGPVGMASRVPSSGPAAGTWLGSDSGLGAPSSPGGLGFGTRAGGRSSNSHGKSDLE